MRSPKSGFTSNELGFHVRDRTTTVPHALNHSQQEGGRSIADFKAVLVNGTERDPQQVSIAMIAYADYSQVFSFSNAI